jgi:hypothetical protein
MPEVNMKANPVLSKNSFSFAFPPPQLVTTPDNSDAARRQFLPRFRNNSDCDSSPPRCRQTYSSLITWSAQHRTNDESGQRKRFSNGIDYFRNLIRSDSPSTQNCFHVDRPYGVGTIG